MVCGGCLCRTCARSVELELRFFTSGDLPPGAEPYFSCDECHYYDGDFRKGYQNRAECSGYIEARKHAELAAAAMRRQLKIIK